MRWLWLVPLVGFFILLFLLLGEGEDTVQVRTVASSSTTSSTTTTVPTTTTTTVATTTTHTHPSTTVLARARTAPTAATGDAWSRLVQCEAGGRWDIYNPPHEGGPQFHFKTWEAYRDADMPDSANLASPAQQIVVAKRVLRAQGVRAWPVCGPRAGLTLADAA